MDERDGRTEADLMSEAALLLDRAVYRLGEVDGLLGTGRGTARRWIDGWCRGHRSYEPLVRPERTGCDVVTWGEFVAARLIAEFGDRGRDVFALRPAIAAMREAFSTAHPLAITRPFMEAGGRELVLRIQSEVELDSGLLLVVADGGAARLSPEVARFMRAARCNAAGLVSRIVLEGTVVLDPEYASGLPTMAGRRLRADIIAEAVNAGEHRLEVARMWDLTPAAVDDAVHFMSRA